MQWVFFYFRIHTQTKNLISVAHFAYKRWYILRLTAPYDLTERPVTIYLTRSDHLLWFSRYLSLLFCNNMIRSYLTEKNSTYLISKAWWSPSPSLSLFWWITFVLDARYSSIGRHINKPPTTQGKWEFRLLIALNLCFRYLSMTFVTVSSQQRRVSFQ